MKSRWLYICLVWFAVLQPCANAAVKTKTLLSTCADVWADCAIDLNSYGTSVRSIQLVTHTFNDSAPDEVGLLWQSSSVQISFYESDYGISAFATAKIEATSIAKQSDGRWRAAKIECFQDGSETPVWTGYNCDLGTGLVSLISMGDHSLSYGYISSFATITYDQLDQSVVTSANVTTDYGTAVTATAAGGNGSGAYQFRLISGGSAPNGAIAGNGAVTSTGAGTVLFQVRRLGDDFYNDSAWSPTYTVTFTQNPNGDNDHDGIPNQWELDHGLNPNDPNDALADPDGDGLTNIAEYNLGSDPQNHQSPSNASLPSNYLSLAAGNSSRTEAVGTTNGQFTVDPSGAATYTIPLWVTPGTAGMQPNLSLKYSSHAGSGIAGFGWSLDGVLKISRLPATLAQDGFVDGVNYNDSDRFALDGQRLILVTGTYGADGAEYRTEIDSFSRVVSYGQFGSGPARFRVWTKDGLILDFGNPSDGSRSDCTVDAVDNQGIRSWNARRISDASGNYMDFYYAKDTANGIHLIDRIEYTGNQSAGFAKYASVKFEYEDRADIFKGYVCGALSAMTKRLKKISSLYGSTVVRSYTLQYADLTQRNTPFRSILSSIQETGLNNVKYPATTFDYTNPENGFTTIGGSGWDMSNGYCLWNASWDPAYDTCPTMLADIDGDGRTDIIYAIGTSASTFLSRPNGWLLTNGQNGHPNYRSPYAIGSFYRGPIGGWFANDVWGSGSTWIPAVIPSFFMNTVGVSDLDGDGKPDFYLVNDFSWWTPSRSEYDYVGEFEASRRLDLNGDGRLDLIVSHAQWHDEAYPPSSWDYDVFYDYVHNDQQISSYLLSNGRLAKARFIDGNADGLPDIGFNLIAKTDQNNNVSYVSDSSAPYIDATPGAEAIDLNGDGLPDFLKSTGVSFYPYFGADGAKINTGRGWIGSPQLDIPWRLYIPETGVNAPSYNGDDGTRLVDINNDGIMDVVHAIADDITPTSQGVLLGTGSGWIDASNSGFQLPFVFARRFNYGQRLTTGAQFVDINGDGAVDFICNYIENGNAFKYIALNKRVNPDRLVKITNGLGATVDITYAPLTERDNSDNFTVYDRTTGATYPMKDLPIPALYVVKTAAYDNGLNNTDGSHEHYDCAYRYKGLREHALRGSVGFESVTMMDSRTGIYTTTTYRQDFPFVGSPLSIKSYVPGATPTLISQTDNAWDLKSLNGGKTFFPYLKQSYVKTWDLNGAFLSAVCTLSDFDDWGNRTSTTAQTFTEADSGEAWATTTTNVYDNSMRDTAAESGNSRWLIGCLTRSTVEASCPQQGLGIPTDLARVIAHEYYTDTGLLKKTTTEPDSASDPGNLTLVAEYDYDGFGNRTSVKISGGELPARTTITTYDQYGRFPQTTKNAKNQTETYGYDQRLGVVSSLTGPNSLTTSWTYDEFGRKILEDRPRSNSLIPNYTTINYKWCGASAPSGSVYQIETLVSGASPSIAVYDRLGRGHYAFAINGGAVNDSPRLVGIRTWYDSLGRNYRTSLPFTCESGIPAAPAYATHTEYDLLNRPVQVFTADDPSSGSVPVYRLTSLVYNGRTVTSTNPKNQISRTVKNPIGLIAESFNNDTGSSTERGRVKYFYDGFGQLRVTQTLRGDDSAISIYVSYDARGRKATMDDPDAGHQDYHHNAAGELLWQRDAKNQTASFTYDELGRPLTRVEVEGTASWIYDTAAHGIGKPASVSVSADRGKSYSESYTYDELGRPFRLIRTIDGTGYSQWQTYDDYSRPLVTIFPGSDVDANGYRVKNVYDALGFLREVRDARSAGSLCGYDVPKDYLYWKADGYSLTGAVNASTLGNGVTLDRVISDFTGRTYSITSGKGQANDVQDVLYTYDSIGNVLTRQNTAVGSNETFRYDGLNRLNYSDVNSGSVINVTYDALGGIQTKTNAGTYLYSQSGCGPHAVTSIYGGPLGNRTFEYDENGNLKKEFLNGNLDREQTWTSYNQVKTITKNGRTTEFWFGANHERVLQQDSNSTKTVYIGSAMEIITTGSLVERKTYVMTPAGRVAVRTERSDATAVETRFLHQDALGSVTAVTDEFGNVEQRFAFDAWGQRMQTANTRSISGGKTTRGYTDHEQLDDYGLIHMNGRVYDPILSRFLSTDAYVQNPFDNQTFNRYSYVQNNPIGRTDPTGMLSVAGVSDSEINVVFDSVWERMNFQLCPSAFADEIRGKALKLVENFGTQKDLATGTKPATYQGGGPYKDGYRYSPGYGPASLIVPASRGFIDKMRWGAALGVVKQNYLERAKIYGQMERARQVGNAYGYGGFGAIVGNQFTLVGVNTFLAGAYGVDLDGTQLSDSRRALYLAVGAVQLYSTGALFRGGPSLAAESATVTETQLEFSFARGASVQTPGITAEGETFVRVGARPVNLKFGATPGGVQSGTYAFPEATFNSIGENPAALKNFGDLPGAAPQYYRILRPPAGTPIQRGIVSGGEFGGTGGVPEVIFPNGF